MSSISLFTVYCSLVDNAVIKDILIVGKLLWRQALVRITVSAMMSSGIWWSYIKHCNRYIHWRRDLWAHI